MRTITFYAQFLAVIALVWLLLTGCATIKKAHEPAPQAAPMQPVADAARVSWQTPQSADGSIWTDAGLEWFGDDKAHRPGDIVMVKVVQKNTGTKNANTDTKRESSISAKIKYLLGFEDTINNLTDAETLIESTSSNEFAGSGETTRQDTLEATVSAIVTEVLPNGNLVVYGHQTVTINNEASVLTVQGVVRPTDIDKENTVDSMRIANADIRFTGSGVLTDKQHPGLGMRAFDWIWPF